MALLSDLLASIIVLVTEPFSLCKLACIFCLKTALVVVHVWMDLIRAVVSFHVNMFCKAVILTVALTCLPIRVLTALQRERMLEKHLQEMQFELENLLWDRKELDGKLQAAIKRHRILESVLVQLEEEHDKAVAEIESLLSELQDLKEENHRLKEIQDQEFFRFKGYANTDIALNTGIAEDDGIPYGIPSWKSSYVQSLLTKRDAFKDKSRSHTGVLHFLEAGPITSSITPKSLEMGNVLDHKRGVALSRSVFGAMLSLLVGVIIWESEDPCMPLVGALFTVVGISLKSVVQFFSTIENKPASDAVTLLSLNWFLLGTLTYPALPRVARMLAPLGLRLVDLAAAKIGITLH